MDYLDDPFGKVGGGWGIQPNTSTSVPNSEEQTGEEDLNAVLRSDMFAAFDSLGPGGGLGVISRPRESPDPRSTASCVLTREIWEVFSVEVLLGQMG